MTIRRRIVVSGRVQGVFYRDACSRQADRIGVGGRARNLDDGRVEVIVEGDPDAVEAMTEWCRTGSEAARVEDIEVEDEEPRGDDTFSVD
jgi:acylphosphatase